MAPSPSAPLRSWPHLLRALAAALLLALAATCGGGGGGGATPTPAPDPDFSLSASVTGPVQAGGSIGAAVHASRTGGHGAAISLGLATNAAAISGSGSLAAGASDATLPLAVPAGTAAGTYALTVQGTDGSRTRSTALSLTVTAPDPLPDYAITASPAAVQAGASGAAAVGVTRTGGHAAALTLGLAANPQGVVGSGTVAAGATSGSLTLSVPAATAAGTLALTVTATDGTRARTAPLTLTVGGTPPPVAEGPSFIIPSPDGAFRGTASLTTGLPLARGAMTDPAQWRLETAAGAPVPAQLDVAARWPDGTVRWVHVSHEGDVAPGGGIRYRLVRTAPPAVASPLVLTDGGSTLTVATGAATFAFTKAQLLVDGQALVLQSGGTAWTATPGTTGGAAVWPAVTQPWTVEVSGPVKAVVRVEGDWRSGATALDPLVRWRARLTFWRGSARVRCEFTLRNARNYDTGLEPVNHGFHALPVDALRLGTTALLPPGQSLGAALEKTFDLEAGGGPPTQRVLDWDPAQAYPTVAPRPLGFPDPAYVASTGAFGPFAAPVTGGSGELQEALDRAERLMRAMAVRADAETVACARPGPATAVEHLAASRGSWLDYGCLVWAGNGCPQVFSRNHYDHVLGLYQNALRSGRVELMGLAQIMARHELDLDHYHTADHGPFYNFMRNWEEGDHRSPGNCFGLGRPSHTWARGYLVHWLWAAEPRGLDVLNELVHGAQAYLYEGTGHPWRDREIRHQGWMSDLFLSRHILDPLTPVPTAEGPRTPVQLLADILEGVVLLEEGDGSHGYVRDADGSGNPVPTVHVLVIRYAAEPMVNAYEFALKGSGHPLENRLRSSAERMVRYLVARTLGGTASGGTYTPMHFWTYMALDGTTGGDPEYAWTQDTASLAGWLWLQTREPALLAYARKAYRDFSFYRDGPADPASRVPARYGSCMYWDTESKLNGWFLRGGQWFLKAEAEARALGL